jgi:hypothetical protein
MHLVPLRKSGVTVGPRVSDRKQRKRKRAKRMRGHLASLVGTDPKWTTDLACHVSKYGSFSVFRCYVVKMY